MSHSLRVRRTLSRDRAKPWLGTFAFLCLLLVAGCSGGDSRDAGGGYVSEIGGDAGGSGECEDEDGDGFGKGCALGPDCDDSDAEVTDGCYRCANPGTEGCACDGEGALAECGKVLSRIGDQITCGYGWSTCSEGRWGPCVINNSAPLPSGGDAGTGFVSQAIGGPSPNCVANPCDPYCQAFDNDTPDGIVGDNIVATDGGLTLNEGSDIPVSVNCSGGTYGTCGHSICEIGGPLTWGCDNDSTSCGTPTAWEQVDADEAYNQEATNERYVVWTPSWPSVEAPDQIDPIATAERYTVYTPAFPSVPAAEPVNAQATDDRWLAYNPTFPSVPATSVPDPAATEARYQHYSPSWPTNAPSETVGDPGTGASFYDPDFPSVPAVEVQTGNSFTHVDPAYPPLAPSVADRGKSYDLMAPSFPLATPTDVELGVNNYVNPPYPGVSPSEVGGGSANYTDPTPGTTAPIGGAELGSACGGVGTPHVGGVCQKRPDAPAVQTTPWTNQSVGTTLVKSDYYDIPAGTLVDLRMTRVSGSGQPDFYVRATGNISRNTHFPRDENNAGRTMPPTSGAQQPTIVGIFPGPSNTGDVGTAVNTYHCAPRVTTATSEENCRFFFATSGRLQFGVRTTTGTAGVRVVMSQTPMSVSSQFLPVIGEDYAWHIRGNGSLKVGSIALIRALQETNAYDDLDLYVRLGGWDWYYNCAPYQTTAPNQTEMCILYMDNGAPAPGIFSVGINAYYGYGFDYELDVAVFDPIGDCPVGTVLDPATNTCCACASGETTGNGCGANECGKKCPAGQEVCGNKCCAPKSCPAGYVLSGDTCVWDGLSCTGAVCAQGSCEMINGAPKCKIGCEGGSSHVCSNDPSKCCSYTCPDGYSLVSTGPNTWACQAITSTCTQVANDACATVSGGGWSCDASTGTALCRKSCGDIVAGSHACSGNPYACCQYQCPAGYTLNGGSCEPITDSCTPLAQTLCADMGASCVIEGGQAVCKKAFSCQDRNPNWHACGVEQCCESTCSNPDYVFDAGQCKPKTNPCTNTAQSACSSVGGTCELVSGTAKCRVPLACVGGHVCPDDPTKCCAFQCQDPDHDYLNTSQSPPVCENRDCSLPDVCEPGDTCEDADDYEHPNQQCRRFDSCPEGTFLCHGDRCCTYECDPGWVLNTSTMLCEQRSCAAPDVCNPGDVCLDTGPFAASPQCRHDTGVCVGGTHQCGESCCVHSCNPEPQPGYNYPNGSVCERRDCGLCTEAGDYCAGATAEAGCLKDQGCGNGTHACGSDPTQCCDYTCPPPGNPDYTYASGSRCEKRDCGLCTEVGDECLGAPPNVQCRHDNGCSGGGHDCNGGACCKPTCPPPGMPDFDVHVTDPIFGERCEYHGCDLCGADECLGSTADSGCKHDYGCPAGTYPCSDDPLKCCDAVCPPAGNPGHTLVNGQKCEKRDCGACPDGTTCVGTAPDIQCCGGGFEGGAGCVAAVCDAEPKCCNVAWTAECVALAKSVCNIDCIGVGPDRNCAVCYKDDIDHDGDGYSWVDGDCMDCTGGDGLKTDFINPGAYDVPGNGIDDDCSGVADDEIASCDTGLILASNNAFDYARAVDLCRIQPEPGKWGVTAAKLVRTDANTSPGAHTYGILPNFGSALLPERGNSLAAFSTGTARRPGDPNFVKPKEAYNCSWDFWNGWVCTRGSRDWGYTSLYPQGYPVGAGCPRPSGSANDSSGLWMQIRVPTNARAFTYNLNYYSSEYPEWVCSQYNDSFVALLTSNHPTNVANAGAPHYKNISFDGNDRPINVNNNYFVVTDQARLTGSGFDGTNCRDRYLGNGQVQCGASTGWLTTSAPVTPGELITVHFAIWDTTDHIFDSTILLDNWRWSTVELPIQTQPEQPGQPYVSEGSFVRDYDASELCGEQGTAPRWARWNWTAKTPSSSKIEFYVATANTLEGLQTAEEKKLVFDDVTGWPASMTNKHAIAKRQSTAPAYAADTQSGSTNVDHSLAVHGLPRTLPYLRIRSRLMASEDFTQAPLLQSWSLEFDCLPAQ